MELFIKNLKLKSDEEKSNYLYYYIKNNINNHKVILNFKDTKISTILLNNSIGKIFSEFDLSLIFKNLKIKNIKQDDKELLRLIINLSLNTKKENC